MRDVTEAPVTQPGPGSAPGARLELDVEHYAVELTLHPAERRLEGRCELRLFLAGEDRSSVTLDLFGLEVSAVTDARDRRLAFEQRGDELLIELQQEALPGVPVSLTVDYGGIPRKGIWFVADRGRAPDHVFTQGECEDARGWLPCHDVPWDRASLELSVNMPAGWDSVAAGRRISQGSTPDGGRRDRWRLDRAVPPYLFTLVAGDLVVSEAEWDGVPLTFHAPARHADRLFPALEPTSSALTFLEDYYGVEYPWSKYSQACVEEFPLGGMENVSATTLSARALRDERGLRDSSATELVVHEAAHQWFGDLVSCADWSHVWIQEGLATFSEHRHAREAVGAEAEREQRREAQERWIEVAAQRALVHDEFVEPLDLFFSGHAYEGGASFLHLASFVLGEEVFRRGLTDLLSRHGGGSITTTDLQRSLERASGEDLSVLFEQWVYSPGVPSLSTRWSWDEERERVLIGVDQVQELAAGVPAVFEFPLEVELGFAVDEGSGAGDAAGEVRVERHRVRLQRRRDVVELECAQRPFWVRVDPDAWIPARIRVRRTPGEWQRLAALDPTALGRREALRALALLVLQDDESSGVERDAKLRSAASHALEAGLEDSAALVRAEALLGLVELRVDGWTDHAARLAQTDESPRVRVRALQLLARDAATAHAELGAAVFAEGYSWTTMVAAVQLMCAADPERAFDTIRTAMNESAPHGELRAPLTSLLARLDDERVPVALVEIAGRQEAAGVVRAAALEGLGAWAERVPEALEVLVGAAEDDRMEIRNGALEGLLLAPRTAPVARALEAAHERSVWPPMRRKLEAAMSQLEEPGS